MIRCSPFRYSKTSPEIIRLTVMMCILFALSPRNVEDLLHERASRSATTVPKGSERPLLRGRPFNTEETKTNQLVGRIEASSLFGLNQPLSQRRRVRRRRDRPLYCLHVGCTVACTTFAQAPPPPLQGPATSHSPARPDSGITRFVAGIRNHRELNSVFC